MVWDSKKRWIPDQKVECMLQKPTHKNEKYNAFKVDNLVEKPPVVKKIVQLTSNGWKSPNELLADYTKYVNKITE